MNLKAWIAELFGTFAFVFVGVGSVVAASNPDGGIGNLGVALAHGVGLAVAVSGTAAISGGHINPAISLMAWLTNRLSFGNMLGYVASQVVGSLVAIRCLVMVVPNQGTENVEYGLPVPAGALSIWQALSVEAVLTAFLALAVLGTMMDKKAPKVGGLYVGLTVFVGALAAGSLTGACVNPARYLGPAIASMRWESYLVYLGGPIIGAAVMGLIYDKWWEDKEAAEA